MDDVREAELIRPDGRLVAWTECGDPAGTPLLRVPGTPGSRWSVRSDRRPWAERALFVLTTERPGFGRSTRLPGRGFLEHADDLVAILDERGIERTCVIGGSGAAPHILALCGRHPDRVAAATILVGITPLVEDEIDRMIPLNVRSYRAGQAGDREAIEELIQPLRGQILADPFGAFESIMATAPEDDLAVLRDPSYRAAFARSQREAHAQGIDGWADENFAITNRWDDIDLDAIEASITWYHAAGDRNCPLSAAQRLVDRIPTATLVEWPPEVGHLHGFHKEAELLDELLARA